ncbi:MAG: beta-lactamase family protein [Acidimicrobiales bacterium]|nr:beta-lactamase family protein [Acidimicrobiales bacterium]MCB9392144.1 beta-lactamase family protein [Acidimicrobiaceae bacterium]
MSGISRQAVLDACGYFDGWLDVQRRRHRVPGVQAAVWHDGEVVFSTALGVSDESTGEPLTTGHLFRIASHSKTFTATAVMQLVERGDLRLDDTVGQWVPALAGTGIAAVKLRELMAHAGGVVRDGWDGDFWQLFHAFPDQDELVRIATDAADVVPRNERFKYSNVGYSLLGQVIEAASGQTYRAYVAEHVVGPLGLVDTGPDLDPARADRYAGGHGWLDEGRRLPIDHIDTGAMSSATGFFSTAEELVRYAGAHCFGDDRLLSDDAKREMQRTEWEVEGTGTSYGLGFAIHTIGGRRVIGHGGGYPGHITRTHVDPVDRLAVSVFTNAIDGPALGMANAAVALVNLAADQHTPTSEGAAVAGVDPRRFCGRFANVWGAFDVVALGGRLLQLTPTLDDPTASYAVLDIVDDHTLRYTTTTGYGSYGEPVRYTFGDDGTVLSLRGGSGSTSVPLDRYRAAVAARDRLTLGDRLIG